MIFEAGGVSDDELDEIRKGILKEIRGQSSGIAGLLGAQGLLSPWGYCGGSSKQEKIWSRFRSALLLHLSSGIDSVLILKLNEYPCVSFPHLILLIKVPNVLQLSVH